MHGCCDGECRTRRRPLLVPHEGAPRGLVEAKPDITLAEIQAASHERMGARASHSTIHNALRLIDPYAVEQQGAAEASKRC